MKKYYVAGITVSLFVLYYKMKKHEMNDQKAIQIM